MIGRTTGSLSPLRVSNINAKGCIRDEADIRKMTERKTWPKRLARFNILGIARRGRRPAVISIGMLPASFPDRPRHRSMREYLS